MNHMEVKFELSEHGCILDINVGELVGVKALVDPGSTLTLISNTIANDRRAGAPDKFKPVAITPIGGDSILAESRVFMLSIPELGPSMPVEAANLPYLPDDEYDGGRPVGVILGLNALSELELTITGPRQSWSLKRSLP